MWVYYVAKTIIVSFRFFFKPLGVCALCQTHTLARLQWSRLSDQWTLLPNWKLSTVPEMKPLRRQRSSFYARFCLKRREMAQPRLYFSQPRQSPHSCFTFFASTNLSSKRIVLTDNMQPKFHDEYIISGYRVKCALSTITWPKSKYLIGWRSHDQQYIVTESSGWKK